MQHICIRAIIYASLFISFALSAQSPSNPSKNKNVLVEGSGSSPLDKNVVAADIDWEASGVGPDDEDGDVVEGSGGTPGEVEGSGLPSRGEHPARTSTTTTSGASSSTSRSSSTTTLPSSTTITTTLKPPQTIATTVITITTEDTKKQEGIFNVQKPLDENELKFGEDDDDDDDDDDDESGEEDGEDGLEDTTFSTTTTQRLIPSSTTSPTTTTTSTKRPPSIAIGTEPPVISEGEDEDIFAHFLKPGILAAIAGGALVGILLAILLVMFIVYRIKKKDEGSYSVDESSHQPHNYSYAYQKAATKEFYA